MFLVALWVVLLLQNYVLKVGKEMEVHFVIGIMGDECASERHKR